MPLPFSRYRLPISSHTLKEKLLFCVCAIIGVVSELITISNASYLFPHPQAELNYKLSLAVSVALFFFAGFTNLWGEILYGIGFLILSVSPLGTTDFFGIFSICFISIHLIVQHYLKSGVAYLFIIQIILAWSTPFTLEDWLITLTFIDPIVLFIAFGFRYINDQSASNAQEAQKSKENETRAHEEAQNALQQAKEIAEITKNKIQADLALYLHDTIAKDLARIALSAESIRLSYSCAQPELAQKLEQLSAMAHQASAKVRPMIVNMNAEASSADISTTISNIEHMLFTREIELDTTIDSPYILDHFLSRQALITSTLILREGAANALKYSPERSCIQLFLEIEADTGKNNEDALKITMINNISPDDAPKEISSGFGLLNLQERIKQEGGEFSTARIESTWILQAKLFNVKEMVYEQLNS